MSLSATDDQRWPTYFPSLVTYCQYGASPTFVQANRCSVGDVVMITPDAFTYQNIAWHPFFAARLPSRIGERYSHNPLARTGSGLSLLVVHTHIELTNLLMLFECCLNISNS